MEYIWVCKFTWYETVFSMTLLRHTKNDRFTLIEEFSSEEEAQAWSEAKKLELMNRQTDTLRVSIGNVFISKKIN